MKAFYGSRFSPNMTRTPEGFLICHNVPIARTGWQEYLGQEIGLSDLHDKVVPVYRSPEEVFAPATMASFEGKSVTDEHPSDDVRPDNYASYEKGQVTNVRQGAGEESDLLLADLITKDPRLISEIESGKREVSCGYHCIYEPIGDGKYTQRQIRGNHVAIVTSGRAGDRVAIKDASPKKQTERRKDVKVDKNTLVGKILAAFAKDAEPEELAEASKMMGKDMLPPTLPAEPKANDEGDPAIAALTQKIDALAAVVAQLVQSDKEVHKEGDPMDALAAELEGGKPGGEESQTVPAESMDEAPVTPPEDRPENPIPGADRNVILNAIKAVKPVIAAIKDPAERKKASDALAKSFRDQLGAPVQKDGYAALAKAKADNARVAAKDAEKEDPMQMGKDWAKKFNPHYKEVK